MRDILWEMSRIVYKEHKKKISFPNTETDEGKHFCEVIYQTQEFTVHIVATQRKRGNVRISEAILMQQKN